MKKFFLTSISMAIGFLLIVFLYGKIKQAFTPELLAASYTMEQVLLGVLAESVRAIITSWLYIHHKADKSLLSNALLFGLMCTLLIGSVWIVLGAGLLAPDKRMNFVINDSIILLLQALLSGVVLWLFYKNVSPE